MNTSYTTTPQEKTQRPDRPEWAVKKAKGDVCENIMARFCVAIGLLVQEHTGLAPTDLTITGEIECKNDVKSVETGNIAVELSYRGKPSGIATSTASGWAILSGDTLMLMPTAKLKELVASKYLRKSCGEGAVCALVPIADIRSISRTVKLAGGAR